MASRYIRVNHRMLIVWLSQNVVLWHAPYVVFLLTQRHFEYLDSSPRFRNFLFCPTFPHHKDPPPPSLNAAISRLYGHRYGVPVDPATEVVSTSSGTEALYCPGARTAIPKALSPNRWAFAFVADAAFL